MTNLKIKYDELTPKEFIELWETVWYENTYLRGNSLCK